MKLISTASIVAGFLNLLDLILTLFFYDYEINPLVISNPELFYIVKMSSSFILLTFGFYFRFL